MTRWFRRFSARADRPARIDAPGHRRDSSPAAGDPPSGYGLPAALGDVAILVLGLNAWAGLVLIPALLHTERGGGAFLLVLIGIPVALLVLGVVSHQWPVLLGAFPLALLAPIVADPRLAGVNVYSRWSFALVAASLLAYTFGSALLLRALHPPPASVEKPLERQPLPPKWRRRRRMYLLLAVLSGAFPLALVRTLYLDGDVQAALREFYPERAAAAGVLFGALAIGIWLLLFQRYFLGPLQSHIRGDREAKRSVMVLRHTLRRGGPRPGFYVWVVLALSLMAVLFLTR